MLRNSILIAAGIALSSAALSQDTADLPNALFAPIQEDPGIDAVQIEVPIHVKKVNLEVTKYKWTRLGYGTSTEKILVPGLAQHTLREHRNFGEEAPCLSGRTEFQLPGDDRTFLDPVRLPLKTWVEIEVGNTYRINRDNGSCRVATYEKVKTTIEGLDFSHYRTGREEPRFIGDCP